MIGTIGIILAIVGFTIAVGATIAIAVLEIKYKKRYEWILALTILGVGLGFIGVMLWSNATIVDAIGGAEERIADAIRGTEERVINAIKDARDIILRELS